MNEDKQRDVEKKALAFQMKLTVVQVMSFSGAMTCAGCATYAGTGSATAAGAGTG